jgi:hypothetical protein
MRRDGRCSISFVQSSARSSLFSIPYIAMPVVMFPSVRQAQVRSDISASYVRLLTDKVPDYFRSKTPIALKIN